MSITQPRPGRPRDPRVAATIEECALRLVADLGFDAVSMEMIAAAARVGKPTLYRRWATKADLLIEAISHRMQLAADPPDTGSLRGDLLALFSANLAELGRDDRLAIGVASALPAQPELARAIQEHTDELTRRQAAAVLGRAVTRGELPPAAVQDDFYFQAGAALLLGRAALTAAAVDEPFVVRVVDELLLPALLRRQPTETSN